MRKEALISNYGLFWRLDELKWDKVQQRRPTLRLLGCRGRGTTFQIADFRTQSGLYVLYSDYGPYYVGLVRSNRLGNRLRDHLTDRHKGKWDRFSWFGFRSVLPEPNGDGVCMLGEPLPSMPVEPTRA